MTAVTFCLTNWRRPESLKNTIESLKRQSVRTFLFLWNNGSQFEHPAIDWSVASSANRVCLPRWYMGSFAETEFVASIDDDVVLTEDWVLDEATKRLSALPESTIVGPEGVNLIDGQSYKTSHHFKVKEGYRDGDEPCDIIKGKFMLLRTSELRRMPFGFNRDSLEDDIALSGLFAQGKRKHHLCLTSLNQGFQMLDAPFSLYKQEGHFERRQRACELFFPTYRL